MANYCYNQFKVGLMIRKTQNLDKTEQRIKEIDQETTKINQQNGFYPARYKDNSTSNQISLENNLDLNTPISKYSFKIPGLGHSGPDCGKVVAGFFSECGQAVKYNRLNCGRKECPDCWNGWALQTVFKNVLKLEILSRARGQRPKEVIFSVPPTEVKNNSWTWTDINTSLFRRAYRKSKSINFEGGLVMFHPFRIKTGWKRKLKYEGWATAKYDAGYWKGIREKVSEGQALYKFVLLGPHLHGICFGKGGKNTSKDYLIKVKKSMKTIDLIKYLRYTLSHIGVLSYNTNRSVRSFGCCRVGMEKLEKSVPKKWLIKKKQEIAELMGLAWNETEGLTYKEENQNKKYNWVPIYQLGEYLRQEDWASKLTKDQMEFFSELWGRLLHEGNSQLELTDLKNLHKRFGVEIVDPPPPDKPPRGDVTK